MTDQNAAEILRIMVGMRKDIGELLIENVSLHSALTGAFPQSSFAYLYSECLASEKVLQLKREIERQIGVLLEKADRLSKA
ncbi:MAG TPA: hypothetical protein VIH76_18760 [Candidatus Acidoferrales bacterium]